LARGVRMVELLKQEQYRPMSVQDQVISIFAGINGYLDDVPVAKVRLFEEELLEYFTEKHPDIQREIVSKGKLDEELTIKLRETIGSFKANVRYLTKV